MRRSRNTVYNLHARLVFVTKYRSPVFTDTMLTLCEQLMRSVCAELDADLREFNGEADLPTPSSFLLLHFSATYGSPYVHFRVAPAAVGKL